MAAGVIVVLGFVALPARSSGGVISGVGALKGGKNCHLN